jgi:hypothetical protein
MGLRKPALFGTDGEIIPRSSPHLYRLPGRPIELGMSAGTVAVLLIFSTGLAVCSASREGARTSSAINEAPPKRNLQTLGMLNVTQLDPVNCFVFASTAHSGGSAHNQVLLGQPTGIVSHSTHPAGLGYACWRLLLV